ncbi:hypothetical protein TYRP_010323 [Tyrophagus putrescentiae]|nr:hypothetical protein TYRP_010323 [Tyrophagus putrescentiae]
MRHLGRHSARGLPPLLLRRRPDRLPGWLSLSPRTSPLLFTGWLAPLCPGYGPIAGSSSSHAPLPSLEHLFFLTTINSTFLAFGTTTAGPSSQEHLIHPHHHRLDWLEFERNTFEEYATEVYAPRDDFLSTCDGSKSDNTNTIIEGFLASTLRLLERSSHLLRQLNADSLATPITNTHFMYTN